MNSRIITRRSVFVIFALLTAFIAVMGCATTDPEPKPAAAARATNGTGPKPEWKGQTLVIDFDVGTNVWGNDAAGGLSPSIKQNLIDGVADDDLFRVQDQGAAAKYLYKVSIVIADPIITLSNDRKIQGISATFRIKSYDKKGNLVAAKTCGAQRKIPAASVASEDTQRKLLEEFARDAAADIKRTMYESL